MLREGDPGAQHLPRESISRKSFVTAQDSSQEYAPLGACPGRCSGHGVCKVGDMCSGDLAER